MQELSLTVGEEQSLSLGNYIIKFHFNPFEREWLFDMSNIDGTVCVVNCVIRPNTYPLNGIDTKWEWPRICMLDKEPDSKEELNPINDFGGRLGIFEITEA